MTKILDFGLAKLTSVGVDSEEVTASSPTKPGVLMGTVAYMSPEQVQAQPVDARSDLFSFGVVLYELLGRKHPFRRDTVAATLTAILQETPFPLHALDASIPPAVDGIVRRCLEKGREERFQGAHDLGLALEAVLQAPTGSAFLQEVEERSPYPGLSSFTEKDASVFFGRESEVKALWERIRGRKLLAVIGPSGVGKTSFLRAGVIPARPEGWAAVYTTPGSNPALGLARALTPDLAGDAEAIADLLSGVHGAPAAPKRGAEYSWGGAARVRAEGATTLVWDLADPADAGLVSLHRGPTASDMTGVAFHPEGRWLAAARALESIAFWPLDWPRSRSLRGHRSGPVLSLGFSADSRLLVSCARDGARVWSLDPGLTRHRRIDLQRDYFCYGATFSGQASIAVAVPRLDLYLAPTLGGPARRAVTLVSEGPHLGGDFSRNAEVMMLDLAGGSPWKVASHGRDPIVAALDATGARLATGDREGVIRVGRSDGGMPHLLPGESRAITGLAISPDGKWIASASGTEIRLWPMPDLSKPPLHTLPYEELMGRLRALTNLRAVEDGSQPTGYRLEIGPFPGWRDVPTW